MADLSVLLSPTKNLQNGLAQASAEKREHTGPTEKERVASVQLKEQLPSTPKPSVQST